MTHHEHGAPIEKRKPGHDSMVVAKAPVAVELGELREEPCDVVERVRPVRVSSDQHPLPGCEVGVDLPAHRLDARPQLLDLPLALRGPGQQAEGLDFLQQDDDRFLEVERLGVHTTAGIRSPCRRAARLLP